MPPPPSTLYMNEFPRQQISQTNFRQSVNTVQQCFRTPTVSNNQTVFTTRPQQNANMPTDNSSATHIEPTNAAVTHSHPQVQPPQTSTPDANYPPVCIKLPPIQIPKFNGDPLAFHDWINIFKAMVHSNHSITQTHRITYLQNSVTGRAKDLIRGYSCNPALYDVALAELQSHFGSPQHVVSAYIKRLESWSRITTQNPHTLVSFATFLKQMVQTFTDLHYTADLQSSTVLSTAKTKLPHNLLTKWTEYTIKSAIEIPTLLHFQHWLEIQAEVIEKLEPFLTTDTAHQPDSTERDFHRSKPSTSTPKKQRSCPLCNQFHFIAACPHYREASTSDKLALVRKHQLCFNCLCCIHQKNECPSRNHCFVPGCSAMHHTSLHPVDKTAPRSSPTVRSADTSIPSSNRNSDTSRLSTHTQKHQPSRNLPNSRRSQQLNRTKSPHFNATAMNNDKSKLPTNLLSVLQIIPVLIINGKRIVDTYALIDPGSTGTYIVETIAKSIDLKTDRKFNMNVQFLSASKSLPVSRTNFTIAPYADNEKTFSVQNAFCTDHISLPPADVHELNTICQSSPHLRHIKLPNINNGHIGVLLGTDCIAVTYALEWIRGSTCHPSWIRTELGWIIAGEFHVPRRKKSRQLKSLIFYALILVPSNRPPHLPIFSNNSGT